MYSGSVVPGWYCRSAHSLLVQLKHDGVTFDQIDHNLRELHGEERDRYRRELLGQTIYLKGAVSAVGYDGISLSLGQETATVRIKVDIPISAKVPSKQGDFVTLKVIYEEGDFVSVRGRIYEISDLFGLLIRVADAEIERDE